MPVIAERLSGGAEEGQQHDCEGADQPQAVASIGSADVHRTHAHAEAQILSVPKRALDSPTFSIEVDQGPGGFLGGAGGQAPRFLYISGLHANYSFDWIADSGDRGIAQHTRASAGAYPVGRRTDFAVGGGYRDIAAEADDEIELQFLGQHPVELSIAEAAVGDDAHLHIGGQHLVQANQDPILVAVRRFFSVAVSTVSQTKGVARPWRVSSDSMIVAWPSASKSVQSIATLMSDRLPTTYGTHWCSKLSMSIPWLDSKRSTCFIACLVVRPRARAKPWPIIATASDADSMTPNVAPASDATRLACRSAPNIVCSELWMRSNESTVLVRIAQPHL